MSLMEQLISKKSEDASKEELHLKRCLDKISEKYPNTLKEFRKETDPFLFSQKINAYYITIMSRMMINFQAGQDSALLHILTPTWKKPLSAVMKLDWSKDDGISKASVTPSSIIANQYPLLAEKLSKMVVRYDISPDELSDLPLNEISSLHQPNEKILMYLTDNGMDNSIPNEIGEVFRAYQDKINRITSPDMHI